MLSHSHVTGSSDSYVELRKILLEPIMMADHSGSTMEADAARPSSVSSRSCTPPPPDMPCPTAENWCYTQVCVCSSLTDDIITNCVAPCDVMHIPEVM